MSINSAFGEEIRQKGVTSGISSWVNLATVGHALAPKEDGFVWWRRRTDVMRELNSKREFLTACPLTEPRSCSGWRRYRNKSVTQVNQPYLTVFNGGSDAWSARSGSILRLKHCQSEFSVFRIQPTRLATSFCITPTWSIPTALSRSYFDSLPILFYNWFSTQNVFQYSDIQVRYHVLLGHFNVIFTCYTGKTFWT